VRIGLRADKVHDAYQRLIEFDNDERHHINFKTGQNNTATEHNNICAQADDVLWEVDGPQQGGQQQPGQIQGDIVAATVAAMNAANGGNAGPKKMDYQLKPKILGKDFTTSELRSWCSGMVFFWAAQAMETRDVKILWANFYDCMHSTQKNYFQPRMPRGIGICNPRNVAEDVPGDRATGPRDEVAHSHKARQSVQAGAEGGPVLRPMAHPPVQPRRGRKGGQAHRQRLASLPPHSKL
jgi:hypothetical protein